MNHWLEHKANRDPYAASTHKGIVNGDEDEHGSEDPPVEGHLGSILNYYICTWHHLAGLLLYRGCCFDDQNDTEGDKLNPNFSCAITNFEALSIQISGEC